jgi:putative endonuclease
VAPPRTIWRSHDACEDGAPLDGASVSRNVVGMWYFYVLESLVQPNYFYKGSTNSLERRLSQHNGGEVMSSNPYKPYRLVYYEAYLYEFAARMRESSVKKNGNISTPLLRRIKESLNYR